VFVKSGARAASVAAILGAGPTLGGARGLSAERRDLAQQRFEAPQALRLPGA